MTEEYELGWCNSCGSTLYEEDDYETCQNCGEIMCDDSTSKCSLYYRPLGKEQIYICRSCEDGFESDKDE